jgi:MerT mercuric transport protein
MMPSNREDAAATRTGQGATVGAAVGTATAGVGAAVTATLASVCCAGPVVAPIVVGLLGATGAAAAAGLKPYTPYLFAISLVMLAIGFRSVYRARRSCLVSGSASSPGVAITISQTVLWFAATLWVASVIFTLYSLTAS